MKSSRNELLKDLKEVCPEWYETIGIKLRKGEGIKTEKVRVEIVNLFKPVLEKIITKNIKELNDGSMTITYKTLIENLK